MEPGDYVGDRFWVGEQVGAGGMGVVYKALDEQTEHTVALKVFTGRREADIARARREAMAVAMLDHPGIVKHVANGLLPDGRLFLAMEWIDGVTIAERIDRVGFTLREAVATARQLATALAVAHDAGIVHRDLKPNNAILADGEPSRAKLIDFGVARFGTVATSLTLTGIAMGTPGYMAPEQVRGDRELTPATDVFGLGVVFYECATGSYTFTGDHAAALMAKVLFADPQPLNARCAEAPPALVRLADAMLAKEPHLRPADGAAVVAALDAIGPIPDGPRRRLLIESPLATLVSEVGHCIAIAAHGSPDEVSDPPPQDVCMALGERALDRGGRLEVLGSGAVVAHFRGSPAVVVGNASAWADHARSLLPDWTVVVSGVRTDVAAAADHGGQALVQATIARIFKKS